MHVWRKLLKVFRTSLGVDYKGSSHTDVDTTPLVLSVKSAAEDWELLEVKGKTAVEVDGGLKRTGEAKKRTIDAVTLGTERLSSTRSGGTIPQFNKTTISMALGEETDEFGVFEDDLPPPPDTLHDTGRDGDSDDD